MKTKLMLVLFCIITVCNCYSQNTFLRETIEESRKEMRIMSPDVEVRSVFDSNGRLIALYQQYQDILVYLSFSSKGICNSERWYFSSKSDAESTREDIERRGFKFTYVEENRLYFMIKSFTQRGVNFLARTNYYLDPDSNPPIKGWSWFLENYCLDENGNREMFE